MSDRTQRVVPALSYEDGLAALEWLARAFGLRERAEERHLWEDGRLAHAEVETEGGDVIALATPTPDYEGPRRHREHCEPARRWSSVPYVIDGLLVYVDDVEAHYERARREGATILSELEDGPPARRYRAEDLEGHRWMFMQRGGA
ncbi:MAG TPA: VOC family protein [Pyrinomonadaceae bacterium]|nr:VOC family protein [Pyrinomonadaceae bacterium]